MDSVLLIAVAVIMLCVLFNKLSGRLGVPMLLAFIVLGMLLGSDGILFKIQFDDFNVTETLCSVAMIFIMFYGGTACGCKRHCAVLGRHGRDGRSRRSFLLADT